MSMSTSGPTTSRTLRTFFAASSISFESTYDRHGPAIASNLSAVKPFSTTCSAILAKSSSVSAPQYQPFAYTRTRSLHAPPSNL